LKLPKDKLHWLEEVLQSVAAPKGVTTKAGLLQLGFAGFITVQELLNCRLPQDLVLKRCGVYVVVAPPGYLPVFISPEEARARHNVLRPWPVEKLLGKWVASVETLYIGAAGIDSQKSLAQRLKELGRHASGRTRARGPHTGGEILWQLRGFEAFEVGYLPTEGSPVPRQVEKLLLSAFVKETGKAPFANRRF